MGWNDLFTVEPMPHGALSHMDEVEEEVLQDMAPLLEQRVRSRLDVGIDMRTAHRASAVRAIAEGGRIVIKEDSDRVLAPLREADAPPAKDSKLDDLFTMGSGVPTISRSSGGEDKLVFRQLKLNDIFATSEWQEGLVESASSEAIYENVVDSWERAMEKVKILHLGEKNQ